MSEVEIPEWGLRFLAAAMEHSEARVQMLNEFDGWFPLLEQYQRYYGPTYQVQLQGDYLATVKNIMRFESLYSEARIEFPERGWSVITMTDLRDDNEVAKSIYEGAEIIGRIIDDLKTHL